MLECKGQRVYRIALFCFELSLREDTESNSSLSTAMAVAGEVKVDVAK